MFFEAFACATIDVAACCKTVFLVSCVVSIAKSASSTRLLAASVFATTFVKLSMTWSKRFDIAPKFARIAATLPIARSILDIDEAIPVVVVVSWVLLILTDEMLVIKAVAIALIPNTEMAVPATSISL